MGMTDRHEKTLTDMAEAMSYGGAVPGMCHFRRSGEPVAVAGRRQAHGGPLPLDHISLDFLARAM